jgi:hypothetical protein
VGRPGMVHHDVGVVEIGPDDFRVDFFEHGGRREHGEEGDKALAKVIQL